MLETKEFQVLVEAGTLGNLPDGPYTKEDLIKYVAANDALRYERRIGLWGVCNFFDYTSNFPGGDWRAHVIELLRRRGMSKIDLWAYNPDKGEFWTVADTYEEDILKDRVKAHVFYVGKYNRSTVSLLELLAAMLYGWNVFPVVEMMQVGHEVEGQVVTEIERHTFNIMRRFVIDVAEAIGVTIYPTLELMANAIPLDDDDLDAYRSSAISPMQIGAVKSVLKSWGMDSYTRDSIIQISDSPFTAQVEVLGVIAACLIRKDKIHAVKVHFPNPSHWDGQIVDGIEISGRRFKDMKRTFDPYFEDLLGRGEGKVSAQRIP